MKMNISGNIQTAIVEFPKGRIRAGTTRENICRRQIAGTSLDVHGRHGPAPDLCKYKLRTAGIVTYKESAVATGESAESARSSWETSFAL